MTTSPARAAFSFSACRRREGHAIWCCSQERTAGVRTCAAAPLYWMRCAAVSRLSHKDRMRSPRAS
jgi:hypothetical protein